jgi:hypothetical protein
MPLFRGAISSPREKLAAAMPFRPISGLLQTMPASFGCVPPVLSILGNGTYGCCVSSQTGASIEAYSLYYGIGSETVVQDSEVIAFARAHGILNGAVITDVMDIMQSTGMTVGGKIYKEGPYKAVDWTNYPVLSAAIYQGPVNISVAANQVENSFSQTNGWWGYGWKKDSNQDHCVPLFGFGSAGDLASILKVNVPSAVNASDPAVLFYTWGSIGIVLHASLLAVMSGGEAWLRTPTTVGVTPPQPTPVPPPVPPGPTPTPSSGVIYIDTEAQAISLPSGWSVVPTN